MTANEKFLLTLIDTKERRFGFLGREWAKTQAESTPWPSFWAAISQGHVYADCANTDPAHWVMYLTPKGKTALAKAE